MHWIFWVALALIALIALRYGADSRDGEAGNPFAPRGSTASGVPSAPVRGYRRAHTPADDVAAVSRAARGAVRRRR
jgi:hypothetical protein